MGVLFQTFEWYSRDDGKFYEELAKRARELAASGITAVWMPPFYKGSGTMDVGYTAYDYFDIGEFEYNGNIRTKYGTKEELLDCIKELHENSIDVYADVVYNHKGSADFKEKFLSYEVDPNNRLESIGQVHDIEGWTGFDFPQREGKYSDFVWHYYHFNGVDYDDIEKKKGIFKIVGDFKDWESNVSGELGNYDYLMFADIDHSHPEVKKELFYATDWLIETTGIDGIRFDAVKHIDSQFLKSICEYLLEKNPDFFLLGEYWNSDENQVDNYLKSVEGKMDLFDVPLHFNFYRASLDGKNFDLRRIFDNSLVSTAPTKAVTFVDNHDTQFGQALNSPIADWFLEIAYALILLRKDGYPCVFSGNYYGIGGDAPKEGNKEMIDRLLEVRLSNAHGEEDNYFENENLIGWVRRGDSEHSPLAVLISTGDMNQLKMFVGEDEKGKIYVDRSLKNKEEVIIDDEGFGLFTVGPGSVTFWSEK